MKKQVQMIVNKEVQIQPNSNEGSLTKPASTLLPNFTKHYKKQSAFISQSLKLNLTPSCSPLNRKCML